MIDGVVRSPSAFSITFALSPSSTATHEFVVPKSIPMILPICVSPKYELMRYALVSGAINLVFNMWLKVFLIFFISHRSRGFVVKPRANATSPDMGYDENKATPAFAGITELMWERLPLCLSVYAIAGSARYHHHCWANKTTVQRVAFLHNRHNRIWCKVRGLLHWHCLV